MNIKKILIIFLFLLILANITIDASYAVSNEKIKISNYKWVDTVDEKIVSIDIITVTDKKNNYNVSYKINIKKANQNKYKIQSVKCKYSIWNIKSGDDETIYRTYDGKNKTSLTIKVPWKIEDNTLESMTINYQTKNNIKKESTKLENTILTKYYLKGIGKKSEVYYVIAGQDHGDTTYEKFNIKTTNKKYKIKTVQLYYDIGYGKTKTITFNVKGKTSFAKVIKEKFVDGYLTEFKITYY